MKILNISTSILGGAGRAAFRLHESLLREGIDSHFLCMDNPADLNLKNENVISVFKHPTFFEKVKNKLLKLAGIKDKTERGKLEVEFKNIYPQLNCEIASLPFSKYKLSKHPSVKMADVIILHWVAEIIDYPDFFQKVNKPVIWTLHDMNPFLGIFHYKNDEIRNATVAGILDAKILSVKSGLIKKFKNKLNIVTPSSWLKTEANKSSVLGQFSSFVIPNSLDLNIFSLHEKSSVRDELRIPRDKTVLLFISESASNYRKGFDLLLEALKLLPADEILLVSLGYNSVVTDSKIEMINAGVIRDDAQLVKYYAAADAFVMPSREDNLPNVMLESFACGTPVIGFPVGGIKEHVKNFETGILAQDISYRALADALITFIEMKNRFSSEFIRIYAEKNFSEKLQVKKYAEIFKALKID